MHTSQRCEDAEQKAETSTKQNLNPKKDTGRVCTKQ